MRSASLSPDKTWRSNAGLSDSITSLNPSRYLLSIAKRALYTPSTETKTSLVTISSLWPFQLINSAEPSLRFSPITSPLMPADGISIKLCISSVWSVSRYSKRAWLSGCADWRANDFTAMASVDVSPPSTIFTLLDRLWVMVPVLSKTMVSILEILSTTSVFLR